MAEQAQKLLLIADGRIVTSEPGPDGKPMRKVYMPGEEADLSLFTDAEIKRLRRTGFLKLPSEVLPAEEVSEQLARLRAEVAALREAQALGVGGGRTADLADQTAAALAALTGAPADEPLAEPVGGGKGGRAR